jgi:hypothetical protein
VEVGAIGGSAALVGPLHPACATISRELATSAHSNGIDFCMNCLKRTSRYAGRSSGRKMRRDPAKIPKPGDPQFSISAIGLTNGSIDLFLPRDKFASMAAEASTSRH